MRQAIATSMVKARVVAKLEAKRVRWSVDHLLVTTAVQQHSGAQTCCCKRGWGIAATGSQHSQSRARGAASGTFKGDGLHVGRDIELEKQSTWHSEHSSTLRQVQDEILRGGGVRVSHPSG